MTKKEKKAIEMYKKGDDTAEITKQTKVNPNALYKLLRKADVPFRQDRR